MSAAEQRKAEEVVVRQLEEKRDAKKRAHEMEWFHKVENDEIASDEDDKWGGTEEESEGGEGKEGEGEERESGDEDEWSTEDGEDSDAEDWKGDSMEFVGGIIEVQRKSGYAFIEGLRKAEEIAMKKEDERYV